MFAIANHQLNEYYKEGMKGVEQVKIKKFGGSSLKDIDHIRDVASFLAKDNDKQIVVVSAREGFTNQIINDAKSISNEPSLREIDQMIVTGEMINAALLAIALNSLGVKAISANAMQLEIISTRDYGDGRILSIDRHAIEKLLDEYQIVVVTGFQGINEKEHISLGRGGSDTTALALAKLFNEECYIYTDVSGVYSVDPRIMKRETYYDSFCFDDMLEFAVSGNKVLSAKAAAIAKDGKVRTHILKSLSDEGTIVDDVESYGVKGIEIVNDIAISHDSGDELQYIILDEQRYAIVKKNGSNVLFNIVGSFMLKAKSDKALCDFLSEKNIKPMLLIARENYIGFIIESEYKNEVLSGLIDIFKL